LGAAEMTKDEKRRRRGSWVVGWVLAVGLRFSVNHLVD
jgi:hypothetical protein